MAKTNTVSEKLIAELIENYMEKIFYFCLKKTGNRTEAEDLTQDIALNILAALNQGTVPESFSAWVWRIARNHYSLWADRKHRNAEFVTGNDIGDYEIEDESENALDKMIRSEQLALLRRELAFIESEYREIIVAYYIEDKSVRGIAASLSLSEAAVKQRLYRARNTLKEGMNMAREFGPKSYKPENVDFAASGPQPTGLPWSQVQRRVQRNILLEAASNPSTIEELSIALGIAAPYMEDEVNTLVWATLLKKVGDKYVTNFPIVSKEAQERGYEVKKKYLTQRADIIDRLSDELIPVIRGIGAVKTSRVTDGDIKWWVCAHSSILSERSVNFSRASEPPVRENGERWGFIGQEEANTPGCFISDNWSVGENGWLNVHTPHFCSIAQYGHKLPTSNNLEVFIETLKAGKKKSELSPAEVDIISAMYPIARFEQDGTVVTDILTFKGEARIGCELDDDKNDPILCILETMPVFDELKQLDMKIFDEYMEIYKNEGNNYVQEQLAYVVAAESMTDAETLCCLIDSGRLVYPDNPENSTCTAALRIC